MTHTNSPLAGSSLSDNTDTSTTEQTHVETQASNTRFDSPMVLTHMSGTLPAALNNTNTLSLNYQPHLVTHYWQQQRVFVSEAAIAVVNIDVCSQPFVLILNIYECDHNQNTLVDTVDVLIKGNGEQEVPWQRDAEKLEADAEEDQAAGEKGPLEYRFEAVLPSQAPSKLSPPLNFYKTIVIESTLPDGSPTPDGLQYYLTTPEGEERHALVKSGVATFEDVSLGSITVSDAPANARDSESPEGSSTNAQQGVKA